MNTAQALQIINDNVASENDSYLCFLHGHNVFQPSKFWECYNAIRVLGISRQQEVDLARELTSKIVQCYSSHLLLIGFHFDKKDGFTIAQLPDVFSVYSLRLRDAVNAFLVGRPITNEFEKNSNEELQNPSTLDLPVS